MMIYIQGFMLFIFLAPAMATDHEMVGLAGYGEEKLSRVMVSGALLCDDTRLPIPGASVAVWCRTIKDWVIRGKTDEYGDFVVDLPSHLHAIPNMERRCRVKIAGVPKKSPCHQAAKRRPKALIKFSSSRDGIRTYSAHNIHLTSTQSQYY